MDLRERSPAVTARHPWELARAAFVLDVLREQGALRGAPGRPVRILDVGAGDTWLARTLIAATPGATACCWDAHYTDQDLIDLAGDGIVPTRAAPTGTCDVALLLDVLEHVDDDVGLAADAVARVGPGGGVLVTVPAWPRLFSSHDRMLAHVRRYTPSAARAVLSQAGLQIMQSGGLFHGLLVPRTVAVAVEHWPSAATDAATQPSAHLGSWRGGPRLTSAITRALRLEQRASVWAARRGFDVPGLSWFAWCKVRG